MRQPLPISQTPVYRVPGTVVVLVVLGLLAALSVWRGVPLRVVIPAVAAVAFGIALVATARRALRRASTRIDTILREELGSPIEQCVELEGRERVVDHHGGRADDASLVPSTRLDDAQLGGGQRK
jgi:hypothetical protein